MSRSTLPHSEWTVVQMLEWATSYFEKNQVSSPRLSIEWLLAHVLQVKRLDLYLQYDRILSQSERDQLKPLVLRRARHEPLQYITGTTYFHQLELHVTPDVLIPRPETEELVEFILKNHPKEPPLAFLDIGTGSGCIALAIKKARPSWNVTAIDNSEKALDIARRNAVTYGLEITFVHASFETFHPDSGMDIIASNPPYIDRKEMSGLSRQVIGYEPVGALVAKNVPDVYKKLMRFCREYLNASGSFYWEINEAKSKDLLTICNTSPFTSRLHKDYAGKDRLISGYFD